MLLANTGAFVGGASRFSARSRSGRTGRLNDITVDGDLMGERTSIKCGDCNRVSKNDLDRQYCPVAAAFINADRPAYRCRFFQRRTSSVDDGVIDVHKENR